MSYHTVMYYNNRKYEFHFEEREARSALRVLKQYVRNNIRGDTNKPDFVVMGYSGRKHNKTNIG